MFMSKKLEKTALFLLLIGSLSCAACISSFYVYTTIKVVNTAMVRSTPPSLEKQKNLDMAAEIAASLQGHAKETELKSYLAGQQDRGKWIETSSTGLVLAKPYAWFSFLSSLVIATGCMILSLYVQKRLSESGR